MDTLQSVLSLTPTEKVSEKEYNDIYTLYILSKKKITLDGSPARITMLNTRFPHVFNDIQDVEFGHNTVMNILLKDCKFYS